MNIVVSGEVLVISLLGGGIKNMASEKAKEFIAKTLPNINPQKEEEKVEPQEETVVSEESTGEDKDLQNIYEKQEQKVSEAEDVPQPGREPANVESQEVPDEEEVSLKNKYVKYSANLQKSRSELIGSYVDYNNFLKNIPQQFEQRTATLKDMMAKAEKKVLSPPPLRSSLINSGSAGEVILSAVFNVASGGAYLQELQKSYSNARKERREDMNEYLQISKLWKDEKMGLLQYQKDMLQNTKSMVEIQAQSIEDPLEKQKKFLQVQQIAKQVEFIDENQQMERDEHSRKQAKHDIEQRKKEKELNYYDDLQKNKLAQSEANVTKTQLENMWNGRKLASMGEGGNDYTSAKRLPGETESDFKTRQARLFKAGDNNYSAQTDGGAKSVRESIKQSAQIVNRMADVRGATEKLKFSSLDDLVFTPFSAKSKKARAEFKNLNRTLTGLALENRIQFTGGGNMSNEERIVLFSFFEVKEGKWFLKDTQAIISSLVDQNLGNYTSLGDYLEKASFYSALSTAEAESISFEGLDAKNKFDDIGKQMGLSQDKVESYWRSNKNTKYKGEQQKAAPQRAAVEGSGRPLPSGGKKVGNLFGDTK